jgi:xanthine dehydrogenase FAD-binding subunit
MLWQDYAIPKTVHEALSLLADYKGEARVVAGGTDLILEIQQGRRPPVKALVDVTRIAGASEIRRVGEYLVIGCGVTHTMIVESALIRQGGAALAEGCGVIGGPQVRNVGTLAGNIAHALPAGDGTIALLALGGEAQISRLDADVSRTRETWMPLEELYLGPGQSSVDQTREIISALRFIPTGKSEVSAFARIMRPQGVALPILGMAVRLKLDARQRDAVLSTVRVAVGPVAPTPYRARATEAFLAGKPATAETIEAAIPVLLEECHPRTSAHRSTSEYRREMLSVLFRQTLRTAIGRAQGGGAL